MPVGAGLARNVSIRPSGSRQSVYRLTRSSAGCVLLRQSTPFAIRSDSSPYLFGYWNNFSSDMNLGPKCDKKGREVSQFASQTPGAFRALERFDHSPVRGRN